MFEFMKCSRISTMGCMKNTTGICASITLEEKKCRRDGPRYDVLAGVMRAGGARGCKSCLPRAAEDEVGIAFGLADPAVPAEGGEHTLDLQQDASALAEDGGDGGARGLIVVAGVPWFRVGFS